MIPPSGFTQELYPLNHWIEYSFGLCITADTLNTALCTLVRHTNDIITTGAGVPKMIITNPHNTGYVSDAGPAVCKMSIIDKMRLSIKFNRTEACDTDSIESIKFLWRPIFFSFREKLQAADDDTGTTVESLLGVTSDTTFEDVVPLTTNKLLTAGASGKSQPVSSVNIAEVFGDYNMTTNTTMEDHVWDETLFQDALRRYTNKGALKSMVGRTRHVTLTKNKPYKNFYFDKFVPKAIRRVQPYSFFAIQVHLPEDEDMGQSYFSSANTATIAHLGCKIMANYHEWNIGHYQDPQGVPPTSA